MTDVNYGKDYYTQQNYVDYLGRGEKYVKLAGEINNLLKSLDLNKTPMLDYGCAVGFLIEGLIKQGYSVEDIFGYDISDYAHATCLEKGLRMLTTKDPINNRKFGVTFLLDVLEHMEPFQVCYLLENLKTDTIVFRIPVPAEEFGDYVLECSRLDKTHVIRWTKETWTQFFEDYGYKILRLNLNTIYDSTGVFCGIALKMNEEKKHVNSYG